MPELEPVAGANADADQHHAFIHLEDEPTMTKFIPQVVDWVKGHPYSRTMTFETSRVPEVTALFWIVKILTTGMGEATSDFLVQRLGPGLAIPFAAIVLGAAMVLQFRAERYVPWTYWLTVAMVAVFGTMAADVLHVGAGIPYAVSTTFFAIVLTAVLITWYRTERTLSIHGIFTPRREAFYWITVITTFALGTAAGDLTATTLGLGYLASGVLFAGLMALPAVGYRWLGLNGVFTFWFAYILTRPLGASFADWLAVSHHRGGLALGPGVVGLALTVVIISLVAYLAHTQPPDGQDDGTSPSPGREMRSTP